MIKDATGGGKIRRKIKNCIERFDGKGGVYPWYEFSGRFGSPRGLAQRLSARFGKIQRQSRRFGNGPEPVSYFPGDLTDL